MRATLFVGDFDGPTLDKVFHDLCRALSLIGREVGFRFAFALWIAREHPANGQRVGSRGIPQCCPGGDFELALRSPVDRKSTRLNSSHANISYAVFCLKKKTK